MVDQNNDQSAQTDPTPSEDYRRGLRGTFVLALVAVALLAGITGNLLSKAFGQGNSWQHISWHDGGFLGGLSPAQVDDRIDRMTKHIADRTRRHRRATGQARDHRQSRRR